LLDAISFESRGQLLLVEHGVAQLGEEGVIGQIAHRRLVDQRSDDIMLDEVERVLI
jgi:hypothetical protein